MIYIPGFEFGRMIECPCVIPVDGKDVLFLSVIGLTPEGDRYHNEFSSIYLIGHLDLENLSFHMESCDELDKGFDFYAPQAFHGKDGQPVYFSWFGCGAQELPYMEEDMWIHGLTMPRILSIQNRKLIQRLPEEIAAQFETVSLTEGRIIWDKNCFHFSIPACREQMTVRLGEKDDCIRITVDPEQGKLTLDRSGLKEQFSEKYGVTRSLSLEPGNAIHLDLYYDNTFGELFVNEGEAVMSFRAFPKSTALSID